MPRLNFVKKARKDNPVVKRGESYYWWQHAFSYKQFSATQPRRSQLTRSAFYASVWDLQDSTGEAYINSVEGATELAETTAEEVRQIGEECQNSLDNMPEQLQYAPTGELLQERIDNMDSVADELENIDWSEFEEKETLLEEHAKIDQEDEEAYDEWLMEHLEFDEEIDWSEALSLITECLDNIEA